MAALHSTDEKDLVLLLNHGDRKAFELLYHRYKNQLYFTLRKLLFSDALAEEFLQEVFFKLWLKREQLDPDKSLPAYLYRVAANLVYDHLRKAQVDKKMQAYLIACGSELYNHVDELIHYKESNEQFQQAIAALPPQRQKIYKLCKIDGKSYEEVGQLLGISSSTIQDHMVKATKVIKQKFAGSQEIAILLLVIYMLNQQ